MPGNRALWKLLLAGARQWRTTVVSVPTKTSDGSVVPIVQSRTLGLDITAIAAMVPAFGLAQDQLLFEKLAAFEIACINIWNEADCTPRQKEKCRFEFGEKNMKWACENCDKKVKQN